MLVTVPERKAREADRRRSAVGPIMSALADYAKTNSGRFLIFGSAVCGSMTYRSDLDVIVDFPSASELPAMLFAEEVAVEHGLPADIHPLRSLRPAFIERIGPGAVTLP